MVNINNVYQKVLALANKEQRGYITPQEFNLFANLLIYAAEWEYNWNWFNSISSAEASNTEKTNFPLGLNVS